MIAEFIVYGLAAYFSIGAVFALWFAIFGIDKFDAAARGAGLFFRVLILPGAAAMWPVLGAKLLRGNRT